MEDSILEKHKLERDIPQKEADAFEKALKLANESYVLIHKKSKSVKVGRLQYWRFEVYCPTTNFSDAYFYLGLLWAKMVLPIWEARHKK